MVSNIGQRRVAVPQHPEKTTYISSEDTTSKARKNISFWRRFPAFSVRITSRRVRKATSIIVMCCMSLLCLYAVKRQVLFGLSSPSSSPQMSMLFEMQQTSQSQFFAGLPHCPDEPSRPELVPVLDVVANWNPNNVTLPPFHYHSLCRFDYQKDYLKAQRYRAAEVPFVVYDVPELDSTAAKWGRPGYLTDLLGKSDKNLSVGVSKDNHFLYFKSKTRTKEYKNFTRPFEQSRMSYQQWLDKVQAIPERQPSGENLRIQSEHYYLVVTSKEEKSFAEDLRFLREDKQLFINRTKHISCRFGTPGVMMDAHFDGHQNVAAVVLGSRRWIIAPPSEREYMYDWPLTHPLGRQSQVDWGAPDLAKYPEFAKIKATEIIVKSGEVLVMPPNWIHLVISIDMSVQCNGFITEKKKRNMLGKHTEPPNFTTKRG